MLPTPVPCDNPPWSSGALCYYTKLTDDASVCGIGVCWWDGALAMCSPYGMTVGSQIWRYKFDGRGGTGIVIHLCIWVGWCAPTGPRCPNIEWTAVGRMVGMCVQCGGVHFGGGLCE